jgi:ribosomal protein S12 methylthiotransferase
MGKKVSLISLGCPKNQVDAEVLLGCLAQDGFIPVFSVDEADVVIVNTCAFIQEAVQESIEVILEAAEAKKAGTATTLIVTGCLPQRYGKELAKSMPEVDLWTGTGDFLQIPQWLRNGGPRQLIGNPRYLYDHHTPRIIANTPHSAYVKIAEGCSHPCTFCLIPRLRGSYRSREMDSIIHETEQLVASGVVEVTLVAQDTTAYGVDRGEEYGLARLLKALTKITGLQWIRFLYAYPHPGNFPAAFLDMVAAQERICPSFDIPLQHIDDAILRRMGRRVSEKEIRGLVYRIKRDYPRIHLRTTLMTGFPGEGKQEFGRLLDFVREVGFTHLGVFTYSPEEGTKASRMKGQVAAELAKERTAQIMEIQQGISWKRNTEMIGSMVPVLIDAMDAGSKGALRGRTVFQAPEVDGAVHIEKGKAHVGEIVTVKITQALPYDLVAEIAKKT